MTVLSLCFATDDGMAIECNEQCGHTFGLLLKHSVEYRDGRPRRTRPWRICPWRIRP